MVNIFGTEIQDKTIKKFVVEIIGTFGLSLSIAIVKEYSFRAYVAGVYLACFSYACGDISGAHLNPAVSAGILTWKIYQGNADLLEFCNDLFNSSE